MLNKLIKLECIIMIHKKVTSSFGFMKNTVFEMDFDKWGRQGFGRRGCLGWIEPRFADGAVCHI